MMRLVAVAVILGFGFAQAEPAAANTEKQEFCAIQGKIVQALSQAKLDRVPERQAAAHVTASATWPEKYNAAVPIYVGEIYKLNRKVLSDTDMAANWREACLAN